jgi:hypothetical protein
MNLFRREDAGERYPLGLQKGSAVSVSEIIDGRPVAIINGLLSGREGGRSTGGLF